MTQHGHVSEDSRKNAFEPALSGDVLTYYQGSDGGCSLTEEIRLCDAMILKSLHEVNFDETRKWIGTKAGLVRSRPRGDSETQELLMAHNATMAHLANQELERMEARHRREDEERERARQAAAAKDAQAEAKPYVTSPLQTEAQAATRWPRHPPLRRSRQTVMAQPSSARPTERTVAGRQSNSDLRRRRAPIHLVGITESLRRTRRQPPVRRRDGSGNRSRHNQRLCSRPAHPCRRIRSRQLPTPHARQNPKPSQTESQLDSPQPHYDGQPN